MSTTKTRIINIIEEKLEVNQPLSNINDEISLLEDGLGLDSISVVNLIVNLEQEFEIKFLEEELNLELFSSLKYLSEFIEKKIE